MINQRLDLLFQILHGVILTLVTHFMSHHICCVHSLAGPLWPAWPLSHSFDPSLDLHNHFKVVLSDHNYHKFSQMLGNSACPLLWCCIHNNHISHPDSIFPNSIHTMHCYYSEQLSLLNTQFSLQASLAKPNRWSLTETWSLQFIRIVFIFALQALAETCITWVIFCFIFLNLNWAKVWLDSESEHFF